MVMETASVVQYPALCRMEIIAALQTIEFWLGLAFGVSFNKIARELLRDRILEGK